MLYAVPEAVFYLAFAAAAEEGGGLLEGVGAADYDFGLVAVG